MPSVRNKACNQKYALQLPSWEDEVLEVQAMVFDQFNSALHDDTEELRNTWSHLDWSNSSSPLHLTNKPHASANTTG